VCVAPCFRHRASGKDGFALNDWHQAEAEILGAQKQRKTKAAKLSVLTAIKLLHTLIWAFLAATILLLPVAGVLRSFAE